MNILGISAGHNASACLMCDGVVVGLLQEERLTQRKNQTAFPKRAIDRLVEGHLDGDFKQIDRVVFAGYEIDPYFIAIDRYSDFEVADHVREMHELWYPHFYGDKRNDGSYWRDQLLAGQRLNQDHNFDFSFLEDIEDWQEAIRHFSETERPDVVRRIYDYDGPIDFEEHHECHAYFALYGATLTEQQRRDSVILTADAFGDRKNWSVSVLGDDGALDRLASGVDQTVARLYKYCTLLLGMKPNEHEYKVMGLSSYSNSRKHIEQSEKVFFEALDFEDGQWVSRRPLQDSYFALKERLEGHRFDNIAAALQNWATSLTVKWAQHWLKETGKRGICFSGGLSMNIKTNGALLQIPGVEWLSVPASGGDESISAGACMSRFQKEAHAENFSMGPVYLGDTPQDLGIDWDERLHETSSSRDDFEVRENVGPEEAAKLLAANCIIARCVGRSEFGARALGNRSILANPTNPDNVKIINDAIKNRDFWMPFTPSILAEYANEYLENPKEAISPYMTIGFESKVETRDKILGGLHFADFSARPQFVLREYNTDYWELIEAFRKKTGVPALMNTSLNLHGDPMNYSLADAARTVALSDLNYLLMPGNRLLYKRTAESQLQSILG